MKTVRINLLQGLVVCSYCGKRLNIQTPKNCATYYRENSHHRGYHDCPYIGRSVRAEVIDAQVAELIRSIHLPDNWEPIVRQMLHEQRDQVDPEAERKDLVHIMIQEVGVDVVNKRVLWVKARPDYEPLFSILDGMHQDLDRRFWVEQMEAQEDNCGIEEDTGQVSTAVEIVLQMSDKTSTCLAIP
jgi:hypothetical protein